MEYCTGGYIILTSFRLRFLPTYLFLFYTGEDGVQRQRDGSSFPGPSHTCTEKGDLMLDGCGCKLEQWNSYVEGRHHILPQTLTLWAGRQQAVGRVCSIDPCQMHCLGSSILWMPTWWQGWSGLEDWICFYDRFTDLLWTFRPWQYIDGQ